MLLSLVDFNMYETQRLILRQWQESDIKPFAELCADKDVMEFFPSTLSFDETVTLVERIKAKFATERYCFFAVELKATHEFIGFIGLSKPSFSAHFTPCTEIGWRLSKKHQGFGYATEGALKCLEIGFNEFQLDEIVSMTVIDNIKSQNVMQKIGMTRTIDDDFMHPNLPTEHKFAKHVLYRISKKQYCKDIQND